MTSRVIYFYQKESTMLSVLICFFSMMMFTYLPTALVSMESANLLLKSPLPHNAQRYNRLRVVRNWGVSKHLLNRESLRSVLQEILGDFIRVAREEGDVIGDIVDTDAAVKDCTLMLITSLVDQVVDDVEHNHVQSRCSWYRSGSKADMAGDHELVDQYLMFTLGCYISIKNDEHDQACWDVDIRWSSVQKFHQTLDLNVVPGADDMVRELFLVDF